MESALIRGNVFEGFKQPPAPSASCASRADLSRRNERQVRFDPLLFIKAIASLVLEWIFSFS
jgi:hypothetical protein